MGRVQALTNKYLRHELKDIVPQNQIIISTLHLTPNIKFIQFPLKALQINDYSVFITNNTATSYNHTISSHFHSFNY